MNLISLPNLRRMVQLCASHWAARANLLHQAGKKDKALLSTLSEMEKDSPSEFADHVGNFTETFLDCTSVVLTGTGWRDLEFRCQCHCPDVFCFMPCQGALLKVVEKLGPFGISAGSPSTNLRARWMKTTGGVLRCAGMISLTGI